VSSSQFEDGRASLWHAEDEDGRDPLPDEASAQGRHRDGTPPARLQSHPGDEHHGHPAADGRDPSISRSPKKQTRSKVQAFTDKQIQLVTQFADQAAIAIENVRLFEAEQQRTRELGKSLEDLRTTQDRLVQTQKLASLGS
jgi:GAF domain-containing protein